MRTSFHFGACDYENEFIKNSPLFTHRSMRIGISLGKFVIITRITLIPYKTKLCLLRKRTTRSGFHIYFTFVFVKYLRLIIYECAFIYFTQNQKVSWSLCATKFRYTNAEWASLNDQILLIFLKKRAKDSIHVHQPIDRPTDQPLTRLELYCSTVLLFRVEYSIFCQEGSQSVRQSVSHSEQCNK